MWRGVPLMAKITAGLVALAALALVVNLLVGVRLLRGHLVDQLDDDLGAAARSIGGAPLPDQEAGTLPSPYYVRLVSPSGRVIGERWAPASPGTPPPALPSLTLDDARELGGRPFTADDGGAGWRVVVEPRGDRAGSLVVARSLAEVDATVARLERVGLLAGVALLGAVTAVAYLAIRRTLGAVPGIEDAALAMLNGDRRARAPEDHRRSELGHIGSAFNSMADRLLVAYRSQEHAEDQARRADHGRRALVADASRELRAPLTAQRSLLDAGRQAGTSDAGLLADLLGQVDRESRRMARLVDDLLLLARLDEATPAGVPAGAPVDLARIARDASDSARVVAADRALVYVGPGPDEALAVEGDEARLRHAVGNLVDNAVTHTPPGTKVVVTASRTRRGDRSWAELSVRDDGPGLTPDQAERVLDRFYRTDRARQRPGGGSGLGLAVVDAIVAAHGGTVAVDTSAPTGVTFRILLPAIAEPDPPARLPARTRPTGPAAAPPPAAASPPGSATAPPPGSLSPPEPTSTPPPGSPSPGSPSPPGPIATPPPPTPTPTPPGSPTPPGPTSVPPPSTPPGPTGPTSTPLRSTPRGSPSPPGPTSVPPLSTRPGSPSPPGPTSTRPSPTPPGPPSPPGPTATPPPSAPPGSLSPPAAPSRRAASRSALPVPLGGRGELPARLTPSGG